jgi:hypothetical protein
MSKNEEADDLEAVGKSHPGTVLDRSFTVFVGAVRAHAAIAASAAASVHSALTSSEQ